jgi:hypothetical protein
MFGEQIDFNEREELEKKLVELLKLSKRTTVLKREALCCDIEINIGDIPQAMSLADDDFAKQIIRSLLDRKLKESLDKLCETLESQFPNGSYCDDLIKIRSKLKFEPSTSQPRTEQSYSLLAPHNFDLTRLIEDCLGKILCKNQGIVGLAIPCDDETFRKYFCERLKTALGRSNILIKPTLGLNPLTIPVEAAINSIKKHKTDVQKRDIICPISIIYKSNKNKSYYDNFWQGICDLFPDSDENQKRLVIVMFSSKKRIFPKKLIELESPQFRQEHVHQWVVEMIRILRWKEEIIDIWTKKMITDCCPPNTPQSELLDIYSVYDHLNFTRELLQDRPNLTAQAFLQELDQRIQPYV